MSAQSGECSDGMDIGMSFLCVTRDLKDMCRCT